MENIPAQIVYISSPCSSTEEKIFIKEIDGLFENSNIQTFIPCRDTIETDILNVPEIKDMSNSSFQKLYGKIQRLEFAIRVYQIVERCCCLVLNINGRVPDEGSISEAGIAYASNKLVILFKNDFRSAFYGNENSMVLGLSASFSTITDIKKIPEAVLESLKQYDHINKKSDYSAYNQFLKDVVELGKMLWSNLEKLKLSDKPVIHKFEIINKMINLYKSSEIPQKLGW